MELSVAGKASDTAVGLSTTGPVVAVLKVVVRLEAFDDSPAYEIELVAGRSVV